MTEIDRKVILSYAANDMNARAAAKELFMCGPAFHYHLNQIKTETGLNPRCFYDLVELVRRAKDADSGS